MNNIIIEGGSTYYLIIILLIIMAMVKHQAKVSKNWSFGKSTTINKFLRYKSIFIHLENVREKGRKNKTHENNNAKMEEKWRKCTCMVSLVSKMKEDYSTETAS